MSGNSDNQKKPGWTDSISRAPQRAAADAEAQWQSVIIGILMLTGGLVMTALSLWDIYIDLGPVWSNLVTLAAGLIITFFYILLLNRGSTSVRLTVVILRLTMVIMVFLHFFWLLVEDVEWSGLLWCLVMLPLFFHLLGYQLSLRGISRCSASSRAPSTSESTAALTSGLKWRMASNTDRRRKGLAKS